MANLTDGRAWMTRIIVASILAAGCSSLGPGALHESRLQYNETGKATSEEELLLNIVRLRYTDTPSSLAVSAIAAQYELTKNFQLTPFFVASGAEVAKSYAAVLPQLGIAGADRPTFTLTPLDEQSTAWTLFKKTPQAVLLLDPRAMESAEVREVTEVFRLKRGLTKFPITQEKLNPFPSTYPSEGVTSIDLETRSLLQALYYVSHGIEIPSEHASAGPVTVTRDPSGQPLAWQRLTVALFPVHSVATD